MARPPKEVREVIRMAERHGWAIDRYTGSGHWKLRHTSGGTLIIPHSPSSYRWRQNALAQIRRIDSKDKS